MARRVLAQGLLLCLAALIPAALCAFVHPKRPAWDEYAVVDGEVRLVAVEQWRRDGAKVLWVDARARAAYEKERIPSALLLNEDDWSNLLENLIAAWDEGSRIVIYCDVRSCEPSKEVAKRLRKEVELPEVYILKGGWQAWQRAHR
jgi:rhodanese-related sulfurtransferase